jgi:hypothetical protein
LRHLGALRRLVHVGQHGQAEFFADVGKDRQRAVESHAAPSPEARPVGLVETRLVDEANADAAADFLEPARYVEGVIPALHLARTGDQRERKIVAEADVADRDMAIRSSHDPLS